ncbi:MAG TPA: DUF192 domain-containing protein [Dehalococcoidia bacterium]|nr:DUF192 domain-containing protein [Dehalococcoidia bacterium]
MKNANKETVIGEAIEVAATAAQRAKGLLGRECLSEGEGLLFKGCSSLHTFFMQFPIDIIYADRSGKVLKCAKAVRPFRLVAAPLRAYYAVELPVGAIESSDTRAGDYLRFVDEPWQLEQTEIHADAA